VAIYNRIADFHDDLSRIRRDIHAHPETAFEETRTAQVVADELEKYGIEVHRGLAKTGVVGSLKVGNGTKRIGLRADIDALDLYELNEFDHKSVHDGKMHGCGHDGHTTMLLGAARYLAETEYVGLVNVLAEKEIVPELLQNNFTVSKVTEIAVRLLQDEDYRATMISQLKSTRTKLGEAGAYDKAGQCIENVLSKKPAV